MMTILIPLGLLGLLGILALILIYVIKPNYQVKHVPSTYVWKLSLKYRKKKLPTSRLRNILLFLCQILILIAIALILAQPAMVYTNATGELDAIAIIDSSASMNAGMGEDIRFLRAVEKAEALSDETLGRDGYMTVIIADAKPYFLARRVSRKNEQLLADQFDAIERNEITCTYGKSDITGALSLCEEILGENPSAKIYLYTDTTYTYVPDNVEVVSVGEKGEWNAAVLSATSELVDGYYSVSVEVACYGSNKEVEVQLDVFGADAQDSTMSGRRITVNKSVYCDEDAVKTLIFCNGGGVDTDNVFYYDLGAEDRFYAYQSIRVSLSEADDFNADNDFYLYDGQKELVKVLYASTDPNPFFTSALDAMKTLFADRWQLQVDEVPKGKEFPHEGYDFYIFEHTMPDVLPTDGALLLADPDRAPAGSGLQYRGIKDYRGNLIPCNNMVAHPVTRYLLPENIQFSRYTTLDFDSDYTAVLSIDADPLLLIQNEGRNKICVMPFSVHFSNIALQPEWIILLYNIFDCFLPATVEETAYEVGEDIVLRERGPRVYYSDTEDPIEEFPATLKFSTPGTYVLRQELYFEEKDDVYTSIFVRIPKTESNIWAAEDVLETPYKNEVTTDVYDDLLVYFAAALFALLFLEWFLQSREGR